MVHTLYVFLCVGGTKLWVDWYRLKEKDLRLNDKSGMKLKGMT